MIACLLSRELESLMISAANQLFLQLLACMYVAETKPAKSDTIVQFCLQSLIRSVGARILLFSKRNRAQIVQFNHLFGSPAQLSHVYRTARSCSRSLIHTHSPGSRAPVVSSSRSLPLIGKRFRYVSVVYLPPIAAAAGQFF